MTRTLAQNALSVLILLASLAGAAAAQTTAPTLLAAMAAGAAVQNAVPTLRAKVGVTSNLVRVGDLIENAGPVADIPIFRSPDLGTTGAVSTDRVLEAIRPYHLLGIDTRGLPQVMVTRLSRAISPQEISARIAQALAKQYGLPDASHIALNFDRPARTLEVEPAATGQLEVIGLHYDARTSRFDATLDLASSQMLHQRPPRFSGTAIATVDTVEVNRPVERGEVLQNSDLTIVEAPKTQSGALTNVANAIGFEARHELRPGRPLNPADLMKPQIVQRNDLVTVVYQAPGLLLTLRGQAQDPGALGDTIGVLNRETKRVVQGVVTGPDRVSVGPSTIHLVENVAPAPGGGTGPSARRQPANRPAVAE